MEDNQEIEIRFKIPRYLFEPLAEGLNTKKPMHVVKESLSLLHWALQERDKGNEICTYDPKTKKYQGLLMPSIGLH